MTFRNVVYKTGNSLIKHTLAYNKLTYRPTPNNIRIHKEKAKSIRSSIALYYHFSSHLPYI